MFKLDFSKWFIRIFALVIAIILWYYVDTRERTNREIEAKVNFRHIPANLYTDFKFEKTVMVKVSGKKDIVNNISIRDFTCYVDLTKAEPGSKYYDIEIKKFVTDISLDLVNETKISITFQKIVSKSVPVVSTVKITPIRSYRVLEEDFEPKQVTISGPENEIKNINEVKTKKMEIKEKKDDFTTTVPFEKLPSYIKINSAENVIITAVIDRRIANLKIENVKVIAVENIFSPLRIVEKELKLDYIIYKGPAKYINMINKKDVRAYIDIGKITKPGNYDIQVITQKFKNVKIIEYSPKSIQITLKRSGF